MTVSKFGSLKQRVRFRAFWKIKLDGGIVMSFLAACIFLAIQLIRLQANAVNAIYNGRQTIRIS